ncbi:hypothetical protein [Mitsuaria sp. GD03876]|uniref:hypothetical protein n=1 Tax=Mitsuaria sp. GD03876 TaxID=2975399 RepID=UPI00244ADB66|nr:hypothetical protein [Mitsuaria sp. GD03876]MDH0864506.1 hypothetical protein [Mitsuaria sp. GD03876]
MPPPPALARRAARLLRALAPLAAAAAQAQVPIAIDSPPKPDVAMKMVYGGNAWRDAKVAAFFGGRSPTLRAEVREVFRARYVERDVDKLMLVYQLTPGPREQFRCAACVPALGAAVLAADAQGRWQLRAKGLLLMPGAPGSGDEDLQLLQLDDQRWALRSRRHDIDRGRESRGERLLLERGGEVQLAAELGFDDKPGPLACGAGAAPQTSGVSVLSPGRGPRVEIVLRFNEGDCPSPRPVVQRTRIELIDDRFQLVPDAPEPDDDPGPAASAPPP